MSELNEYLNDLSRWCRLSGALIWNAAVIFEMANIHWLIMREKIHDWQQKQQQKCHVFKSLFSREYKLAVNNISFIIINGNENTFQYGVQVIPFFFLSFFVPSLISMCCSRASFIVNCRLVFVRAPAYKIIYGSYCDCFRYGYCFRYPETI